MDGFYRAVRGRALLALVLLPLVDVRHPERVPAVGAVLLCINHPNNFIDSLLVGGALRRKVHYLATAALFRHPRRQFLRACAAIPVYRRQDDPDRWTELGAFEACLQGLRRRRLVAIYPEGTTHAEVRVQRIKTGAARLALGYEAERPGELQVIPVGLNFDARKSFRGRVSSPSASPIPVTPYRDAYRAAPDHGGRGADRRDPVGHGSGRSFHVERIDESRLAKAVQELYRGRARCRELREERGLASGRSTWSPVAGHRGLDQLLQAARAGEGRADLAAHPELRALLANTTSRTRRCELGSSGPGHANGSA